MPALERVAVEADVAPARGTPDLRRRRSRPPPGDADLRLDDVDAGHLLGDGVLDLDARIDLDEVEFAGVGIHAGTRPCRRRYSWSRGRWLQRIAAQLLALRRRRDRAPARAPRPSGCGAGSSSRARTDARRCRACRRGPAPRHGGRARPASRDRPRPCRRRPWPRACASVTSRTRSASARIARMPRPPPPHDAFSITG